MNTPELQAQLEELRREVAELRASRKLRARWAALAVVAASLAWASTKTDGLWVFSSDSPAVASEVNDNFNQLRTWMRNKVGADLNSTNVAVPGDLSVGGAVNFGQLSVGNLTVTGTTTGTSGSFSSLTVSGTSTLGLQQKTCSNTGICSCDGGRNLVGGGAYCPSGSIVNSAPNLQTLTVPIIGTIPAQSWIGACTAGTVSTYALCARIN